MISRDDSIKQWLMDEIRHNMGKEAREYLTLYDMLNPLQAYWQRVKPMYLSDNEIMYFTTGKGHEEMLRYVGGFQKGELKYFENIGYRCDVYQNFPCEVKTRRGYIPNDKKIEESYSNYIAQIKQYCAVENKPMGWLWVWALTGKDDENKTKPDMFCYHLEFTMEELEAERQRIRQTRDNLLTALNTGDIRLLHPCPLWMCRQERKDMIKPPYCKNCEKDFQTDWGIKKHIKSKTGKGHEVEMATYKTTYEPKCKWYQHCKGEG